MKLIETLGAASRIWQIFIADSSSTTGGGLTGLTQASAGLTAYYHRDADTTATAITLVTMTVGTFTSSGFKEIDAANMPGWYQFCPPNAALAAGAKSCAFLLKGATNMAPLPIEVQLVAYDTQDAVHLGLSALPNAAAGANTGLPVVGTQVPNANAAANGGLPTVDANNAVKVQSGTGANQVSLSAGTVTVGTNNDKTGYSLSAAGIQAIWDFATSLLTTVGSIGKLLVDTLNATISSRLSSAGYTAPDNTSITAIKTQTDKFVFTVANVVDANVVDWKGTAAPNNTGDAYGLLNSAQAEPAAVPASNASPIVKIGYVFAKMRNKRTVTATTELLRSAGDTATIATATVSDDGTTFVKTEDV